MKHRLHIGALVGLSTVLVTLSAAIAAIGVALAVQQPATGAEASSSVRSLIEPGLLTRTIGVAILIGALATLLGASAGWAMRRLSFGASALLVAPIFLPTYLIYASWGLARAPGTLLGDWIERTGPGAIGAINFVQAIGGLSLWAWPIAAILIGRSASKISDEQLDALRLTQPGHLRRCLFLTRALRGSLALSIGAIGLVMMGSAAPLHVAQINTYAIVIWRLLNESGAPSRVWIAATPLMLVAALAGTTMAFTVLRSTGKNESDWRQSAASSGGWSLAIAMAIWLASTMLPLALFLWSLRSMRSLFTSAMALAPAANQSALVGAIVGLLGVVIATGSLIGFSQGARRSHRIGAKINLVALCITALTPGVLIGSALLSASRLTALDWLASSSMGVALAHTLRFGAIAALVGWQLARIEPSDLADARRLLAGRSLGGWWRTVGSANIGALFGVGLVMALLSAHEIEATIMLAPPGYKSLAQTLLNQLHYLRMEELSAAGVWLSIVGVAVLLAVAGLATLTAKAHQQTPRQHSCRALAILITAAWVVTGCNDSTSQGAAAIRVERTLGEVGSAPGQVAYPRCLDADETSLWIIDKTARVQRWSLTGEPMIEWTMPATERGMPTGITVGPDGLIYVADTHEHRVSVFAKTGELVTTWGDYGMGPGQFIYPTDVAFMLDDDGAIQRVYVSEYGGNDRISAFNAAHEFLFSFGKEGSSAAADNIEFARPQSVLFDQSRRELLVTDSSNHRVGRFTPDGELIAWIGAAGGLPGQAPGQFRYPYGVAMLPDGSILISEFGGNRVQRLDVETGESLGIYGRAGVGVGELRSPWGLATVGKLAFVLDSGSNRVLAFRPDRQPNGLVAAKGGGAR